MTQSSKRTHGSSTAKQRGVQYVVIKELCVETQVFMALFTAVQTTGLGIFQDVDWKWQKHSANTSADFFLFGPHIRFSMLISSPGPVIRERLKQHVLLLLLLLPVGATPRPLTHTEPHMETKRLLQLPTHGTLTLNCNDKGSKNRRTIGDCSSCLNFFEYSVTVWIGDDKKKMITTRELLVKCKWNKLRNI